MNIREFEQLFKLVVSKYPLTDGQPSLYYNYARLWIFNGMPSANFPAVVLERTPNVDWNGLQQNLIPQIETFKFKVSFYDTYHHSEQDEVEFSQKQENLIMLARQTFAELTRWDRIEEGHNMNLKYKGIFIADLDQDNNELMVLHCECTVELKVSCAKLTFNYD
tara:strand:- start:2405 stop:2896 length:492 start_codon:yes stop_codon:yes gene_type:complete